MKKIFIFTFVLLVSVLTVGPNVLAIGQMTKPIEIWNALRGQEIQETLILYNSDATAVVYGLQADGDIKDWATFCAMDNLKDPITEIKIPAQANINALVKFNVPSDTPNGVYVGQVAVVTLSNEAEQEKEGMNVSVGMRVGRDVSITVTDKEMIKFQTSIIPLEYGIKSGQPLKIKVIYDNQGNVSVKPQIDLKILKDDKNIFNAIFPYPENLEPVKPLERKELPALIEWQTTGQSSGNYRAEIKILLNNEVKYETSFRFSIGAGVWGGIVKGVSDFRIDWRIFVLAGVIIAAATIIVLVRKRMKKSTV